jgi:CheY-like chemotaxis protein
VVKIGLRYVNQKPALWYFPPARYKYHRKSYSPQGHEGANRMRLRSHRKVADFDPRFKIFHELMGRKVREILLVSTLYDAWIMEEDCRLSERIINEYRGLNLSSPPRLTWVSSKSEALKALERRQFDLVISMHRHSDSDALSLGQEIKKRAPDLPVVHLAHGALPSTECYLDESPPAGIDKTFVWSGNTDLLLAIVKSAEDRMNVLADTQSAGIRVILFVEDSPEYLSSLLPIVYRELVIQTQALLEQGLNEEHRLLTMRARPKILVAESYEEAIALYEKFEPYILGVISDVRFPRNCKLDASSGVDLLKKVKKERFDIPLLLASSESSNAEAASQIPATFVDKNSPGLLSDVRRFIKDQLGFGDFVFRTPDGKELARASNLRDLEKLLPTIPADSFHYHGVRNDFSRWLFARTEILLASKLRPATLADFDYDIERVRTVLIDLIKTRRRERQKGIVVNFEVEEFDPDIEFLKIGQGSLGGKARGLAFMSALLQRWPSILEKFDRVNIVIPQTLVITTDGFETFVDTNNLKSLAKEDLPDEEIAARFLAGEFPQWITEALKTYLAHIKYPLAVRSSSLLEDAQFRAYAGLYKTYLLPNDHPDLECRLDQLQDAIKLVWASTYFYNPKAFARRVGHRTEEEKMAVIVQQLVGEKYGEYFYPAISGVAQSHNYYPFAKMKPEEGICTIAMGLGRMVMEGEKTLRFSPKYPQQLPERSTVEDILENAQRYFYSLKIRGEYPRLGVDETVTLAKREISDAGDEPPVKRLASTYIPAEHRIRDTTHVPGYRLLTFAQVLKYDLFPLAEILSDIMEMGRTGMDCPVELEFSVDLAIKTDDKPRFALLQIRPMSARQELMKVAIENAEKERAFCLSSRALGNCVNNDMADIVYVNPDTFDPGRTPQIALEIGQMNAKLLQTGHKYVLIGPGRWGSADRWLGIPVTWSDISGVGAMVETAHDQLKAEPSQGSHFFHNITALGICYLTVLEAQDNFLDWHWLTTLPVTSQTDYVIHVKLDTPMALKVDGETSQGVIIGVAQSKNS